MDIEDSQELELEKLLKIIGVENLLPSLLDSRFASLNSVLIDGGLQDIMKANLTALVYIYWALCFWPCQF